MKYLAACLLVLMISISSKSQVDEDSLKRKKLSITPLPIVSANPAFGVIYGFAITGNNYFGSQDNTSMSNYLLNATHTTKDQTIISLRSTIFTDGNKYNLTGDWRLLLSSQPTYGLGTGPNSGILSSDGSEYDEQKSENNNTREYMDFDLLRIHETVLKRFGKYMYLGLGYHYDQYANIKDKLLSLDSATLNITNHYAYSIRHGFNPEGYTTSGFSANVMHDSRDNIANPYDGRFAFISFRYFAEGLGSTQDASTLWLEYRDYFNISKENPRNLIALWTFASLMTSGQLPYMTLMANGWDHMGRSGRPYPQGRWRGENYYYAELEYRFPIPILSRWPDRLGGVVFANMTSASSLDRDIQMLEYWKPGTGIGLRIMIDEESRANLTIDYGWGAKGAQGLFLNLNEYF